MPRDGLSPTANTPMNIPTKKQPRKRHGEDSGAASLLHLGNGGLANVHSLPNRKLDVIQANKAVIAALRGASAETAHASTMCPAANITNVLKSALQKVSVGFAPKSRHVRQVAASPGDDVEIVTPALVSRRLRPHESVSRTVLNFRFYPTCTEHIALPAPTSAPSDYVRRCPHATIFLKPLPKIPHSG